MDCDKNIFVGGVCGSVATLELPCSMVGFRCGLLEIIRKRHETFLIIFNIMYNDAHETEALLIVNTDRRKENGRIDVGNPRVLVLIWIFID